MADQAMPVNNKAPVVESDLLKNIVSTETGANEAPILGEAPELDTSLLYDVKPQQSILLTSLKILFGLLFAASLASLLFFTSQLTTTLNFATSSFKLPNISADLSATNAEIISLQTDLNMIRLQEIKAALDKFSYDGDLYLEQYKIFDSSTSSAQEKADAKATMDELRAILKPSFTDAGEKFSKSFTAPLIDINFVEEAQLQSLYEDRLRAAITDKLTVLATGKDDATKIDLRNYQQTLKLVGNTELKNTLIHTDFGSLNDKALYDLIDKKINALIVNDMTAVQNIKAKRIKWSDIMDEIENRTKEVDKNYSLKFYNSEGGSGIRYNSYDFDSSTRKISINGETKSLTPANFTMIAQLIEALNQSKIFMNAEMRSFSKSGSFDEGYLATLRLVLDLRDSSTADITK
jgi:hypothetical protein